MSQKPRFLAQRALGGAGAPIQRFLVGPRIAGDVWGKFLIAGGNESAQVLGYEDYLDRDDSDLFGAALLMVMAKGFHGL